MTTSYCDADTEASRLCFIPDIPALLSRAVLREISNNQLFLNEFLKVLSTAGTSKVLFS